MPRILRHISMDLVQQAYQFDDMVQSTTISKTAKRQPKVAKFKDGIVINGEFGSSEVATILKPYLHKLKLIVADPPYGVLDKATYGIDWDEGIKSANYLQWTKDCQQYLVKGGSLYMWGGIGKPHNRIFFDYLARVEDETTMTMRNLITWAKRRAYGLPDNYLFIREECAWLVNGEKPKVFHIPYLDQERGYEGWNPKYKAKSKYLRRGNIWKDVSEFFKPGEKVHIAQKPEKLAQIMIETHTNKNDVVMDPFAGSGSTGFAARSLGRKFILIERDPSNFKLIVDRLKNKPVEKKASLEDQIEFELEKVLDRDGWLLEREIIPRV